MMQRVFNFLHVQIHSFSLIAHWHSLVNVTNCTMRFSNVPHEFSTVARWQNWNWSVLSFHPSRCCMSLFALCWHLHHYYSNQCRYLLAYLLYVKGSEFIPCKITVSTLSPKFTFKDDSDLCKQNQNMFTGPEIIGKV